MNLTASYTYDAADRLTQSGSSTYTYDSNGNQLTRTAGGVTTTYSYDLLNRLTAISGPVTASYAYNGDGLRVGKTVGTTTTGYAWDPTGLGTVLSDGSEYVWGNGLVSLGTAAGTTYAHADALGSIRLLTDATGAVAGRQSFDAYGASRSQSGVPLPFGYTGEQTDAESGLVYLRARYLDPATGRFLSRDTFGGHPADPQSLNRHAYAEGDPARYADPSGHAVVVDGGRSSFQYYLDAGNLVINDLHLQFDSQHNVQGAGPGTESDPQAQLCTIASAATLLKYYGAFGSGDQLAFEIADALHHFDTNYEPYSEDYLRPLGKSKLDRAIENVAAKNGLAHLTCRTTAFASPADVDATIRAGTPVIFNVFRSPATAVTSRSVIAYGIDGWDYDIADTNAPRGNTNQGNSPTYVPYHMNRAWAWNAVTVTMMDPNGK